MTESATNMLLWLLGEELPSSAAGAERALDGNWAWDPAAIVLLVVFAAASIAFVLFFYFKERSNAGRLYRLSLAAIRLAIIALIGVLLYGLHIDFNRTSLPVIAVLLDESASMAFVDEYRDDSLTEQLAASTAAAGFDSNARFDVARSLLLADDAAFLRQLEEDQQLRVYTLAGNARAQPTNISELVDELRRLSPEGNTSKLGTGLREVLSELRGTRPTAIVVLTDGVTTEGPTLSEAASYARRKAVPLYIVGIGSENPTRSVELSNLMVDDAVFVEDYVDLEFNLTASGLEGRQVEIVLRNGGTGDELGRQKVMAGPDGEIKRVRISDRPTEIGPIEYVVEVANLQEELKRPVAPLSKNVEVRKAKIKVLLVQGYPNFEYRYLKNLLERDSTIQLRCVLQESDPEHLVQDETALPVFPVRRRVAPGISTEDLTKQNEGFLFTYDAIIFGDVDVNHLNPSQLQNLVDFVQVKGGGVLFFSGERFSPFSYRGTPLAQILPIDWQASSAIDSVTYTDTGFTVRPTPIGMTSPHMQLGNDLLESERLWLGLNELYWMAAVPKLKPGVRVLAEHPTMTNDEGQKLPLFCVLHLPPGKVLWHATDETWRWRFRMGDVLMARYWIQAIRYLSRSSLLGQNQAVQLTTDRTAYQRGTPIRLRVQFLDERRAPAEDDGVQLVIESEDQENRRLTLQRAATSREVFETSISNLPTGKYRAWVAAPTVGAAPPSVTFPVLPPPGELVRQTMDANELQLAAQRSRGRYYSLATANSLLADLPEGRAIPVESPDPLLLWNNWRFLAVLLVLFVTEWLLRKRAGML